MYVCLSNEANVEFYIAFNFLYVESCLVYCGLLFFFLLLVSLVVFTHFPCCFFSLQRANLVVRSVFDLTGGVFVVCCYLILWCCVFGSCLNQFSRALAQEWHCLAGVYVYLCMY